MKVYKGFNKNLQCDPTGCKPFQYEIGGVYKEESAEVCDHGFHACENPIDVLTYYPPGSNRYCEADLDGVVKMAGNSISVKMLEYLFTALYPKDEKQELKRKTLALLDLL